MWILVWGATLGAEGAELPVLTNYRSFWNLPEGRQGMLHRIRCEVSVLYYDADWRILWLENEGVVFFCNPGNATFDIRAGQRALLEALVTPGNGFDPEKLKFTVLGTADSEPPVDAFRHMDRPEELNSKVIRFVGLVESQVEDGANHLIMNISFGRYTLGATVLMEVDEPVHQFAGKVVEVEGLLDLSSGPDKVNRSFYLLVPGQDKIRSLGSLASYEGFSLPISTGTQLRTLGGGARVRVEGRVHGFEAGKMLVLWDESEQIVVYSGQTAEPKSGCRVTAVGQLRMQGEQLVLDDALWMEIGGKLTKTVDAEIKLRRAVQVLELRRDEVGVSVDLAGVVTWSNPEAEFFFLQDSTGGVCVYFGDSEKCEVPKVGTPLRVFGSTIPEAFSPTVLCEKLTRGTMSRLPAPRFITLNHSFGGTEEASLVEIRGYLKEIKKEGAWTVFMLSTPTGEFRAKFIGSELAEEDANRVGSILRLRGVCVTQTDADGQPSGIEILVNGEQGIAVESPQLQEPFSVERIPIHSLLKSSPRHSPFQWVRTSGMVTYRTGNHLIIQSGSIGLEVFCQDQVAVQIGDAVDVVGFVGRAEGRVVLREALVRGTDRSEALEVIQFTGSNEIDSSWDNALVQVDALLEDMIQTEEGTWLYLDAGEGLRFWGRGNLGSGLRKGSQLRCIGVYRAVQNLLEQPDSFELFFRTADDITVLHPPSLITAKNATIATIVVSFVSIVALLGILALRKRVALQMQQILNQMERQATLESELQKAAKLESLGVLAGGIAHDFNNLLQVIMGNITLAKLEDQAMKVAGDCLLDAERGAKQARDLTQQLLTFSRGGEPLKAAEVLPEIVRESSEFVLRGSSVVCEYEFDAELWPVDVDRGQIGQVVHNLVLNAKQAMPDGGVIRVKAHNDARSGEFISALSKGRYVQLLLADTGPGLTEGAIEHLFDPYFTTKKNGNGLGLATVHSIVMRHKGHIEVHSELGHGTVFKIWLPAADGEVQGTVAPIENLPQKHSGRVLIMDDEEGIRRVLVSLMRRLGMDAVETLEGAEAVCAYRLAMEEDNPFSLVIMDLTVPGGMGGREAMEELLRMDPNVRAIVSSGYSNDPVMAHYKDHGFAGRVTKPYEIAEFIQCVELVLQEP